MMDMLVFYNVCILFALLFAHRPACRQTHVQKTVKAPLANALLEKKRKKILQQNLYLFLRQTDCSIPVECSQSM